MDRSYGGRESHLQVRLVSIASQSYSNVLTVHRGVEDAFRLDVNEKLSKYHRKDKTLKLKEAGLVLIYLLRLRQATAHPFLLEPAFKTNLSGKDIDSIRSKLDGMQQHTPVYEQLKLFHDDAVREEFGASKFGYQFDMKAQFHMALDTKNEDLCQLCLTELDDPQENSVSIYILTSRNPLTQDTSAVTYSAHSASRTRITELGKPEGARPHAQYVMKPYKTGSLHSGKTQQRDKSLSKTSHRSPLILVEPNMRQ